MRKILKKIGKVFSKLKETKVKVIITLIVTCIMLIDLNPFFLKAGRETLVYTFNDGMQIPYAFDNNHNSYSYYSISWMGGHVAYCMDYDIKNPPNGTGLQYLRNVKSNKVVAVLMNGYPNKTAKQLGAANNEEAYLATQMAVWAALNGSSETKGLNFNMSKLQPNVKYSAKTTSMLDNSKKITNNLLKSSYDPGIFVVDSSKVKANYDYSDKQVSIGPFRVKTTGYSSLGKFNVSISNKTAGVLLTDKYANQKTTFDKNEDIYIIVDKKLPAGSTKISVNAKANKYVGVVYGKGSWQNFVFLDTEQVDVSGTATAVWEESKGNIKVVKNDQDLKPVEGAQFALLDSAGNQISTGKTDINGNLQFNQLELGNYTLIENTVPDGYIIQKTNYPVTVKRNVTSQVNVQNTKVKGVLQITKIEKNSKTPIKDAVFEIYDVNGKVIDKLVTDVNGIATSSELPKGTYTYKEISVPDGYIMDTETRSFSITETVNAVRQTITNQKIVGQLQISKFGDDGKALSGAEFEIYDKNQVPVARLLTTKSGKGTTPPIGKGEYTYKEIKAPYGYDKDPNTYTFKIETLNEVVEHTITNKKIYGSLTIQKVDENDNPIADVKFEILDKDGKNITSITTDANGIATIDNLVVGKYKYKEVYTPYLYVLDDKEYEFEITSEKREEKIKVVNQRAKGILKIIKIDKDSKDAIANAKFNIIDKSSNEIVDAIITDENGVARTKALPTGEYIYQEVEISDDYILDDTAYEVKIKKNNEMVEKKVDNEHKKLPVTGGFLSTDILIILIVTTSSIIIYVLYKIVKNKGNNPYPPNDYNNLSNSYILNDNGACNSLKDEKYDEYNVTINKNDNSIENNIKEDKDENTNEDSLKINIEDDCREVENDEILIEDDGDELLDFTPKHNNKDEE